MITSLKVENFKCFDRFEASLGQLTLLTGFNSGGKSTALQSLLLLAQGIRAGGFPTKRFPLNGKFVRLGSASDVLPAGSESTEISFRVSTEAEVREWNLKARAGDRSLQFDSTEVHPMSDDQGDPVLRSLARLSFVGATRLATPDDYPMPDVEHRGYRDVGFDGRYAPFEYNRFADDLVAQDRWYPGSAGSTVRKQVDDWMSWLFPGAQANVQLFSQLSLLNLQFRVSEFGEWRRPANVGYGYSYAFPIVVALITAKTGQTIVIDSPEAHLHPRAQSKMGWLLAKFAQANVQVIVESHSDHVLNGVRLAVREGVLRHDLAQVLFFAGKSLLDDGRMKVYPLSLDAKGGINRWPGGFFDQMETDLAQL
jgi:predicted ATPase